MIFNKTVGRVCNIKHTFTYFIKHNKMTLFPMHYARQRHIVFKLFGGDMNAECLESYIFCSLAYTEHTPPPHDCYDIFVSVYPSDNACHNVLLSFANKQNSSPWYHIGFSMKMS